MSTKKCGKIPNQIRFDNSPKRIRSSIDSCKWKRCLVAARSFGKSWRFVQFFNQLKSVIDTKVLALLFPNNADGCGHGFDCDHINRKNFLK